MKKKSSPNVKLLTKGEKFTVKQMKAKAGELLPKHRASIESVLIVIKGECVLALAGDEHILKAGDSFLVPAEIKHQIRVNEDLKALHVMPNTIQFEFFS